MRKTVILWIALLGCLPYQPLGAASLEFEARIDKSVVPADTPFRYKLILTGAGDSLPSFSPPEFPAEFEIVSQEETANKSTIATKTTLEKIMTWTLVSKTPGEFTIPAAEVEVRQIKRTTLPIFIRITPNPANPATPSTNMAALSKAPASKFQYAVFIQSLIDRHEVYVGEPVIYTLSLYKLNSLKLWGNSRAVLPSFQGLWTENLTPAAQTYTADVDTQRYTVYELAKKVLIPTHPGALKIEPAKAGIVVHLFQGQEMVRSDTLTLKVKPLPEDTMPENFSGLVGNLTVSAQLNTTSTEQNQPIKLRIILEGNGNLKKDIVLDYTPTPDMTITLEKAATRFTHGHELKGTAIFEYLITPRKTGELTIPAFRTHYFNLESETYSQLETPTYRITVTPSSTQSLTETLQPATLQTQLNNPSFKSGLVLAGIGIGLLILFFLMRRSRK